MSDNKIGPPRPSIAPEFAGRGGLAAALMPSRQPTEDATLPASVAASGEADDWVVFGVGAIWQTAAENAARLSGQDVSEWLTHTIKGAAADQGIVKSGNSR